MATIEGNIQQRYDTAANFAASNRILLAGEKAIESDTLKEKTGDGMTAYNGLPYSFSTQISAWLLTGISFASSAPVTAADSIRTAIGKLQAQITGLITPAVNAQTGTVYTVVAADNGKIITMDNAAANTVTIPASLGAGFNCLIVQIGAGQTTIAASGTTLNSADGLKIAARYGGASVVAYVANTFAVSGRLTV